MGGLPPFEATTFTRSTMLHSGNVAQSDRVGFGGSPPIRGCDFHPICNAALGQNGRERQSGGLGGLPPFEATTFILSTMLPLDKMVHSALNIFALRQPWPRAKEGGFGGSTHIRGCNSHPICNVVLGQLCPERQRGGSPDLQSCPWTTWPRATEGGWGVGSLPTFEAVTFTKSEMLPLQ